jgi:hypothetical protein
MTHVGALRDSTSVRAKYTSLSKRKNQMSEKSSFSFTYHDPSKNFDGTPYEAAGKAVIQVDNVMKLLQKALYDTNIQARNAYMQRNLDTGKDPNAAGWEHAPEAKLLNGLIETTGKIRKRLPALLRAISYDPKNPPKED